MDYQKRVQKRTPDSPILKNVLCAFISGGLICTFGQGLYRVYTTFLAEKEAYTWVTVTLIFLGVLATATGVFDRLARIAGAGTLVPVTGFANAVASPAMEFKTEGYVTGLGAKMFIISGPVIVYGTLAASLCGLIFYFVR